MKRTLLAASILALSACEAVLLPFDRDTPATMGRPLPSVYDACEDCSRRVLSDGTIWEVRR